MVISKLDKTVVGKEDVILLELECCVSVPMRNKLRRLVNEVIPHFNLFSQCLLGRNQKLEFFLHLLSCIFPFKFILKRLARETVCVYFDYRVLHSLIESFEKLFGSIYTLVYLSLVLLLAIHGSKHIFLHCLDQLCLVFFLGLVRVDSF